MPFFARKPPVAGFPLGAEAAVGTTRPALAPRRARLAWPITLAATVASTYALDAVATAAGVLLVASGLLTGLGHTLALAVLAASYLLWGIGLRSNLSANLLLLRRTATSTNALSKAAFELTRRRGERVQRLAASVGYIAAELAKEAPYYAGAFGAAVLTDAVSSSDALLFLAGANLGAAAYEYGLARLTRRLLRPGRCASFDTDWVPREYLADYYSVVEPDERETIAFFVEAIRRAPAGEPVLVFGTGPTLHHVFLAAPIASELHLADYLAGNLAELERWRTRDPAAHDWRAFIRYTLQCEGLAVPSDEQIALREQLTRSRITRLLEVDARRPVPLDRYATVISDLRRLRDRRPRHLGAHDGEHHGARRAGGLFITAALRGCRSYQVGGRQFPCADVDERDLGRVLARQFDPCVQMRELRGHEAQGYAGVVLAHARRRARAAPRARAALGDPARERAGGAREHNRMKRGSDWHGHAA